jgi:hypothetical protein
MPARLSSGSGVKAPMIAIRQRQMLSRDAPSASAPRRQDIGCGASIMSRASATTRSGRWTRASGVPLRPDHVAPHPEQFHRCAPVLVRPHRLRASHPQRGQDAAGPPASARASISRTASARLRASATSPALRPSVAPAGSGGQAAGSIQPEPQHTSLTHQNKERSTTVC